MSNETEKRKTPWRSVADELPKDGQIVVTVSLSSLECPQSAVESAFGVAVFRKEVVYGEGEREPEYVEHRENVFCTDMWDYPDGEVTSWMPMPMLPAKEMAAYMARVNSRKNNPQK